MANDENLIQIAATDAAFVVVSRRDLKAYSLELIERVRQLERETLKEEQACELLTKEEVKTMLRIKSDATLWRWQLKKKLIPAISDGGKVLYKKKDVKKLLK